MHSHDFARRQPDAVGLVRSSDSRHGESPVDPARAQVDTDQLPLKVATLHCNEQMMGFGAHDYPLHGAVERNDPRRPARIEIDRSDRRAGYV